MKAARAFTLLEVMVVLAIIGGLLSLVTLSGSDRQAEDQTTRLGEQLRALFIAYEQEARLQNTDLGIALNSSEMKLLSLQDLRSQEVQSNKTREELDAISKNPWQAYKGSLKNTLAIPETIQLELTVNGQQVELESEETEDKNNSSVPVLLFLSSAEYTPFSLSLNHFDDAHFQVTLIGDGFNPPELEVVRFED